MAGRKIAFENRRILEVFEDRRKQFDTPDGEDRGFERCPPVLIGDKGYDSDEFTNARTAKGIKACILPRKRRKTKHAYCKTLYRQRHKVECLFGKIKDWRRITTRYDRCAHTFFSAICRATTVIFSLK